MRTGALTTALRETFAVFEATAAGRPLTTSEVATALDLGRRSTYDRLDRLASQGRIETKAVGANGRVWWLPPGASADGGPRGDTLDTRRSFDSALGPEACGTGHSPRGRVAPDAELPHVFTRISDGYFALNEDWRVTHLNDRVATLLGLERAELQGEVLWAASPSAIGEAFEPLAVDGHLPDERREFEAYFEPLDTWLEVAAYPAERGLSVYVTHISDRKRRQQELEQYETIVETVDDGIYVVDDDARFTMVNEAYEAFVGRSREELLGSHVSTVVDDETVELTERLREDLTDAADSGTVELRMAGADGESHTVEIHYTTLDGDRGGTTGVIRDISERKAYEERLERQRTNLAVLDDINTVVRELTADVVEQSTRAEIERTLCTHLAAADSYEFAWFGDVDTVRETVTYRTGAGLETVFDDLTIPMDAAEPGSPRATHHAIETGATQVVSEETDDYVAGTVCTHAAGLDDCSVAVIPVVHEQVQYGLLYVYSARAGAFTAEERSVVEQLGGIVGHAIAAIEQQRALLTDDVVEVEFGMERPRQTIGLDYDGDGRVTLDRTVPMGDDRFLLYGTATDDGELLDGLTASFSHWEGYDVVEDTGDAARVQVRVSEPPAIAAVAAHGGQVKEVAFDAGGAYMRVHLSPRRSVRDVVDLVHEAYPSAELLSKRQRSRPSDGSGSVRQVLERTLTDRQRIVVETAYNAGFFESPRLSSGAEIAGVLGITPATFHQHLRKVQQKLVDAVLADAAE